MRREWRIRELLGWRRHPAGLGEADVLVHLEQLRREHPGWLEEDRVALVAGLPLGRRAALLVAEHGKRLTKRYGDELPQGWKSDKALHTERELHLLTALLRIEALRSDEVVHLVWLTIHAPRLGESEERYATAVEASGNVPAILATRIKRVRRDLCLRPLQEAVALLGALEEDALQLVLVLLGDEEVSYERGAEEMQLEQVRRTARLGDVVGA